MPSDGPKLFDAYLKLDALLVAKGAPATSPAWLAALESFWISGCFRLVVRKGRQVGASTIIAPRVAATTVLFGDYEQSRGSRGTCGFWSHRQKEADERLYNIERTLHDVGVRVKRRDDTIEIPGRPVILQSYPATSDVARGGNYWMVWEDELPAWIIEGANPAAERDASIVPGCITHENARVYSVGTPQGHTDFHAKLVAQGDTPSQRVFSGPSWFWNPTLTEERTRALQPIDRVWKREFAAIPQGDETSIFDPADIARSMRELSGQIVLMARGERFMVIDPSRGIDDWTYTIQQWMTEAVEIDESNCGVSPTGAEWCLGVAPCSVAIWDESGRRVGRITKRQTVKGDWEIFEPPPAAEPRPVLHVLEIGQVPDGADSEGAVRFLRRRADEMRSDEGRVRKVFSDQYEFGSLGPMLKRAGFSPREQKWTAPSKASAVDRLERMFRDSQVRLPANDKLRTQLLEYSEKITRTGAMSYGGRGRHDDYAQVLVTLAMASVNQELPGDPFGIDRRRHETR